MISYKERNTVIKYKQVDNIGGIHMTDSEKLDLLLEKVGDLEKGMKDLKHQQMKDTAELKAMDEIISDVLRQS